MKWRDAMEKISDFARCGLPESAIRRLAAAVIADMRAEESDHAYTKVVNGDAPGKSNG